MSRERPLHGGCSCGRIQYTVTVPQESQELARVFFDNKAAHRRSQATPLSAWLRIPLSWYHSSTHAFFNDENHSSIRRAYTSPSDQTSQRHFCGYCGTPLTYWSETPASEAEYISLTLGSLSSRDLRDLEELGLLPTDAYEGTTLDKTKIETSQATIPHPRNLAVTPASEGLPWFETMVQGSILGNMRRTRGQGSSRDGRIKVEWEVMEWDEERDGGDTTMSGKRKHDVAVEGDHNMEG